MEMDDNRETCRERITAPGGLYAKPVYLFTIAIVSVFLTEAAVMLFLGDHTSFVSLAEMAMLDAALLSLILFPIFYLSVFRPMRNHLAQREQMECRLRKARAELELRVKARTAELDRRTGQLARLSSQLTLSEERERRRIAHILHDHLQQTLVAARMNLEAAANCPQDRPEFIEQVRSLVEESIQESRSLAVELSPPLLYKKGLAAALQWLAQLFREKHGLEVELLNDPLADPKHEEVSVLLFASIRELLFNVVKHAGVNTASVRMGHDENGRLRITVSDAGVGFDKDKVSSSTLPGGFGLFSIQERIELLGGSFQVESAPGRGATFTMIVPIQKKNAPAPNFQ